MGVCLEDWNKKGEAKPADFFQLSQLSPQIYLPYHLQIKLFNLYVGQIETACMRGHFIPHISTNFQQQQQKVCSIKYRRSHLVANANTSEHLSNLLCC